MQKALRFNAGIEKKVYVQVEGRTNTPPYNSTQTRPGKRLAKATGYRTCPRASLGYYRVIFI
jgi:hypothetical protein